MRRGSLGFQRFVVVLTLLFLYWSRTFGELQKAIHPIFPTPRAAIDAPI